MARRTVFDDVFRTICQKLPHLLIPLINEVFGTRYWENEEIVQLRNERFEKSGEIITDAVVRIQDHTYHIECQSSDDSIMIIRMVEYDFSIALEGMNRTDNGVFEMAFPESCVVYLRKSDSNSRKAVLNIHFQDGVIYPYRMKIICVEDYTKEDIFEKHLLMFLPFYILRYENDIPSAKKNDAEKLKKLISEYEALLERLEKESDDFADVYNLLIRIVNHVVKSGAVKRRLANMGGRVLQLESERLMAKGMAKGHAEGEDKLSRLINKLIAAGRMDDVSKAASTAENRDKLYKEFGIE